eukprot:scaffold343625_cov15-Prasinocladus_malaysianus.AAC.1
MFYTYGEVCRRRIYLILSNNPELRELLPFYGVHCLNQGYLGSEHLQQILYLYYRDQSHATRRQGDFCSTFYFAVSCAKLPTNYQLAPFQRRRGSICRRRLRYVHFNSKGRHYVISHVPRPSPSELAV